MSRLVSKAEVEGTVSRRVSKAVSRLSKAEKQFFALVFSIAMSHPNATWDECTDMAIAQERAMRKPKKRRKV